MWTWCPSGDLKVKGHAAVSSCVWLVADSFLGGVLAEGLMGSGLKWYHFPSGPLPPQHSTGSSSRTDEVRWVRRRFFHQHTSPRGDRVWKENISRNEVIGESEQRVTQRWGPVVPVWRAEEGETSLPAGRELLIELKSCYVNLNRTVTYKTPTSTPPVSKWIHVPAGCFSENKNNHQPVRTNRRQRLTHVVPFLQDIDEVKHVQRFLPSLGFSRCLVSWKSVQSRVWHSDPRLSLG